MERRWRCVQHFLFSCMVSPPPCPDPTDLWLDLLDRLSGDTVVVARVRQALHVDSFNLAEVRRFCMPWLLDPFCFLSAGQRRDVRVPRQAHHAVPSDPQRLASARSLAVTRGSFLASAHRELSVALVQSQGYVYRSCALLLAKASGRPVLPGADKSYLD
jgi:hypothetical protein